MPDRALREIRFGQPAPQPYETSCTNNARAAVLAIFLAAGVIISSWIARIPAVQDRFGLSEGQLGLALPGIAAGSLVSMPISGWATGRFSRLLPPDPRHGVLVVADDAAYLEGGLRSVWRRVPRWLVLLGAVAFCCMLGEGAMADWSGVYLDDMLGTSASAVGERATAAVSAAPTIAEHERNV